MLMWANHLQGQPQQQQQQQRQEDGQNLHPAPQTPLQPMPMLSESPAGPVMWKSGYTPPPAATTRMHQNQSLHHPHNHHHHHQATPVSAQQTQLGAQGLPQYHVAPLSRMGQPSPVTGANGFAPHAQIPGQMVPPAPGAGRWSYIDAQGKVQGLFTHDQLMAWVRQGHFCSRTLARREGEPAFRTLMSHGLLQQGPNVDEKEKETLIPLIGTCWFYIDSNGVKQGHLTYTRCVSGARAFLTERLWYDAVILRPVSLYPCVLR